MWKYFFNFSPEVAQLLTQLTVYSGGLPQGAKTSSYLACLLLWDCEPEVVEVLSNMDLAYSRYIDDINVSAKRTLNGEEKNSIITHILRMLHRKNLNIHRKGPKRLKILLNTQQMRVHNLNINANKPSKPPEVRSEIRNEVHQCECVAKEDRQSAQYITLHRHTFGRVMDMARLHPGEAESLAKRLDAIRPIRPRY